MAREVFESNITDFAQRFAADSRLWVEFYHGAVQNERESNAQGRPIYVDTECVKILVPGDKTSMIDRPATEEDRKRFEKQYQQFRSHQAQTLEGTPLEQWPLVTRAQVEEFRYVHVRTVEQLATLKDDAVLKIPGAVALKARAQAWIAAAKDTAFAEKIAAEREADRQEIAELKAALKAQAEQLRELSSHKVKGKAEAA